MQGAGRAHQRAYKVPGRKKAETKGGGEEEKWKWYKGREVACKDLTAQG